MKPVKFAGPIVDKNYLNKAASLLRLETGAGEIGLML
jgi:hypothetical protein